MVVKKGNKIKVEYEGSFEDGTIFDSSKTHGQLLEFEVGAKQVIHGFDESVVGMKNGEEKEIIIQPSEAYGEYNPELIKSIPKEQIPNSEEAKAGMMIMIGLPDGQQMPVKIKDITVKEIILDLNHPLAGKVLKFKIKLVDIIK